MYFREKVGINIFLHKFVLKDFVTGRFTLKSVYQADKTFLKWNTRNPGRNKA